MALNDFITHVKQKGLLVGNKYEIVAPFVDGTSNSIAQNVSMLCNSVTMPGITIMTNDIRYFGESTTRPHGVSYSPVTLTFYLDNDLSAKRYFEQWMNLTFNRDTRELNYYDSYTRDVEIVVYNKAEEEIERIKLFESFPKSVNEVVLDYNQHGVLVLHVSLIYKWWGAKKAQEEQDLKGTINTKSLSDSNVYGTDGTGSTAEEYLNNTGQTISGSNLPNSLTSDSFDLDQTAIINNAGSDIIYSATKDLGQASNLFSLSNLQSPTYENFTTLLDNNIKQISGQFVNLGNNIQQLNSGSTQTAFTNMSSTLGNLAQSMSGYGNLLGSVGANSSEFNTISGQISQTSSLLTQYTSLNQAPAVLNSLSANMLNMGSTIQASVGQIKQTTSLDRAGEIAIGYSASIFNKSGLSLSNIAASIIQ